MDLHQYKPLRAPSSAVEPGKMEGWYQTFNRLVGSEGATQYSERWWSTFTFSDHDPKVREDLLSCDLFPWNFSRYESALHFASNSVNVLSSPDVIEKIACAAIQQFFPTLSGSQIQPYVKKIVSTVSSLYFPCGNLFVICIPKDYPKLDEIFYRAHPLGRKCQCHRVEENIAIAEKLQAGVLDDSTKCKVPQSPTVPQYRVFLPKFHPEQDHSNRLKTFLLPPLSPENKKYLKRVIRNEVNTISQLQTVA